MLWSYLSFHAVHLLPIVVLWSLVRLGRCTWSLGAYLETPNTQKWTTFRMRLKTTLFLSVLSCAMIGGTWSLFARTRARFQPVINAIDSYRQSRGEYPEKLSEMIPKNLMEIPSCIGGGAAFYGRRDDTYHLGCDTFPFYTYSYSSMQGRWRGMD